MKIRQRHIDMIAAAELSRGEVRSPADLQSRVTAALNQLASQGHELARGAGFAKLPALWRSNPDAVGSKALTAHNGAASQALLAGARAALNAGDSVSALRAFGGARNVVVAEEQSLEAKLETLAGQSRDRLVTYAGVTFTFSPGMSPSDGLRAWFAQRSLAVAAGFEQRANEGQARLDKMRSLDVHYYGPPAGFSANEVDERGISVLSPEELATMPVGTWLMDVRNELPCAYLVGVDDIPPGTKVGFDADATRIAFYGGAPQVGRRLGSVPDGTPEYRVNEEGARASTGRLLEGLAARVSTDGHPGALAVGSIRVWAQPGSTAQDVRRQYEEGLRAAGVAEDRETAAHFRARAELHAASDLHLTERPPADVVLDRGGLRRASRSVSRPFDIIHVSKEVFASLPAGTVLYNADTPYIVGFSTSEPSDDKGFLNVGFRADRIPKAQIAAPDFHAIAARFCPPDLNVARYTALLKKLDARQLTVNRDERHHAMLAQAVRDLGYDDKAVAALLTRYAEGASVTHVTTLTLASALDEAREHAARDRVLMFELPSGDDRIERLVLYPGRSEMDVARAWDAAMKRVALRAAS